MSQITTSDLNNICCLAERQTAGKGRRGKPWFSPFAQNIYMSLLWHFPRDLSALSGLSLVAAIAIAKALQQLGVTDLKLKWPNDISWQHKKLSGCLIEISGESHDIASTVIGVGINVHMTSEQTTDITQPWVDLHQITGQIYDRNQLISLVLNEIIQSLVLFQEQGFSPFMDSWKSFDLAYGKIVSLITSLGTIQGIGRGINEQGHLLLELETKELKAFSSGEVSLRLGKSDPPPL
jgi:BirA family biotin operon repressor/biotin-[acetyl-CoA-carboxylase] ligase